MMKKDWWHKPLRVIQPNLQVKDTERIDPERLAAQMEEMGANAICFNVGGIYAWYPTKVEYHTENPFLPTHMDLLEEVIKSCHKRNIKFIARFDFSKAEDSIYLKRPWWFARNIQGEPQVIGAKRPGEWSLLMTTCMNSGYRKEEVAIPVLNEVLDRYNIDAIFYNNPGYSPCFCSVCREKYEQQYGRPMPEDRQDFQEDWGSVCERDTLGGLYHFVKEKNESIPVIMYYDIYGEDMLVRERFGDSICVESQNVLSAGHKSIPPVWHPALSMNLGRSVERKPNPFGIIHSCPGMDWRHTGLPTAEYTYWMSNVPANGGNIWHSLTGVPDTITDKRVLRTVSEINHMIQKVEGPMEDAESAAQTALVWERSVHARGWADGLTTKQILFDILKPAQVKEDKLKKYRVVIVPSETRCDMGMIQELKSFVEEGGKLVLEGELVTEFDALKSMAGIQGTPCVSEYLTASYIRFEGENNPLQKSMEDTELIPLRGRVVYTKPSPAASILATLVPPFSPLESVGAPPERASLAVSHTDIPLAFLNSWGKGQVLYMAFPLGQLMNEYRLNEHYLYALNGVNLLLGDQARIRIRPTQGLQVSAFQKEGRVMIHLVNGAGQRPLMDHIPLRDIEVQVALTAEEKLDCVHQLIGNKPPTSAQEGSVIHIKVPELRVWECIAVDIKSQPWNCE